MKIKELLGRKIPSKRTFWIAIAIGIVAVWAIVAVASCAIAGITDDLMAEVAR